jgi:hypothetical protein
VEKEPSWGGIHGMVGMGAGALLGGAVLWPAVGPEVGYMLCGVGLVLLFLVGVAWAVKEGVLRAEELRRK